MEDEQWLPIEEFPDYEISNQGRVRNLVSGHILGVYDNGSGVLQVVMRYKGRPKARAVHRLVAETFIHPGPDKAVPIFLDGDRTNCSADNLEWKPLWYARSRTKQLRRSEPLSTRAIVHVRTGTIFENSREAALIMDDLEEYILLSAQNGESFTARSGRYEFL